MIIVIHVINSDTNDSASTASEIKIASPQPPGGRSKPHPHIP